MPEMLKFDPAMVIALVALFVSILSFLATRDSSKSARRSANTSEKLAAASRPRISVEITELSSIECNDGVFRGTVTFRLKNKGGRPAFNLSHWVFYLYKPRDVPSIPIDTFIKLASAVPPQYENEQIFEDEDQLIIQPYAGERKEAVTTELSETRFSLAIIVGVRYSDEMTEEVHWSFQILPIAQKNSRGQVDIPLINEDDFILDDLVVHRAGWSVLHT